jgi:acetyl-CoA carboxylase biotin carboxyl carrier protein
LEAVIDSREDGESLVLAPTVGSFRGDRLVGEILKPGSRLGVLLRREIPFDVVLPDGASGELREILTTHRWEPCGYGQPLLRLVLPRSLEDTVAAEAVRSAEASTASFEIASPTHGTFYRRPSPDSPSYVEVGDEIGAGQTLGLVEVMKCFSPISFEPPSGHSGGVVKEITAQDGHEVRAEQVLVRIELR